MMRDDVEQKLAAEFTRLAAQADRRLPQARSRALALLEHTALDVTAHDGTAPDGTAPDGRQVRRPKSARLRLIAAPLAALVIVGVPILTVLAIRSAQRGDSSGDRPSTSHTAAIDPSTDPEVLRGTAWKLRRYTPANGPAFEPSPSVRPATIGFDTRDGWSFWACNSGSGTAVMGRATLRLSEAVQTLVACGGPGGGEASQMEGYLGRLENVAVSWHIRNGELALRLPDHSEYEFARTGSATVRQCNPADLKAAVSEPANPGPAPSTTLPTDLTVLITNSSVTECALSGLVPVTLLAGRVDRAPAAAVGVLKPGASYAQPFHVTGWICSSPMSAGLPGTGYWTIGAEEGAFHVAAPAQMLPQFVNCEAISAGKAYLTR